MAANWDEKFLREAPFMPFGSMMNAWARIKAENPDYPVKQFLDEASVIFTQSQIMVKDNFLKIRQAVQGSAKPHDPEI